MCNTHSFMIRVCSSLSGIGELLPEDSYAEGEVAQQEGSYDSEVSKLARGVRSIHLV